MRAILALQLGAAFAPLRSYPRCLGRRPNAPVDAFEGPEKTLEVCFTPGVGDPRGCRALSSESLDTMLAEARCTIISKLSNAYLDAYVLSESSLFVYPHKLVVKTCGRTTLLRCLPQLVELSEGLGLRLEWVGYSRKNFQFPQDQPRPHTSFEEELNYLRAHKNDSLAFDGHGYLLGPITGDHWFVYVSDRCERPAASERTVNIMMFDLDQSVEEHFFSRPDEPDAARRMTSSLASVLGDDAVDAHAFQPCGYSMNALHRDAYTTVHVTPQRASSYASYETNKNLVNYDRLIADVLAVFKPKQAVVTLFADAPNGLVDLPSPFDRLPTLPVSGLGTYERTDLSSLCVETDCVCVMANFLLDDAPALPAAALGAHAPALRGLVEPPPRQERRRPISARRRRRQAVDVSLAGDASLSSSCSSS